MEIKMEIKTHKKAPKEIRYPAAILDHGGICYRSYEFVIFIDEYVSLRGSGYTAKAAARSAAADTAKMFDIKIYWKRERHGV